MEHYKENEKELLFDPYQAKSIYIEENQMKPSEIVPKDTGSSYLMCLLFGIAAVLPWNVIIAAMDIFETKVFILVNNIIFYSCHNTSLLQSFRLY